MDFAKVLDAVSRFLDQRGFRDALAGAFALSAYGLSRKGGVGPESNLR